MADGASAGSAPAASLKLRADDQRMPRPVPEASAGSAPAASLKRVQCRVTVAGKRDRIRGVCPRGLIEASCGQAGAPGACRRIRGVCPRGLIEATSPSLPPAGRGFDASAGSAPAASLKRHRFPPGRVNDSCIRGVCPRGLIEARAANGTHPMIASSIRGVCPRGLIEADGPGRCRDHLDSGIRGVCPRGLIEASKSSARGAPPMTRASAGSAPAASLKQRVAREPLPARRLASAGSAPAASLKLDRFGRLIRGQDAEGIRGVCPRGLIEAAWVRSWPTMIRRIRGVCPRGLIEA